MALTRRIPAIVECSKACCAPIFSELADEEFAQLQRLMIPLDYVAGDLICQEGMPANGIYVICRGLVKYGKYSADRTRKRNLRVLGARELLGLGELFSRDPCTLFGFAKALEDTTVVFLEKRQFLEFVEAHPQILFAITELLSREMAVYESQLAELAYEPVRVSLARLLLVLARQFGVRWEDGVEIEFSRSDLAELVGTHVDSLTRILAQLKEEALISTQYRKIRILDVERLAREASPHSTSTLSQ